jgi:hypothetical protein
VTYTATSATGPSVFEEEKQEEDMNPDRGISLHLFILKVLSLFDN